MPPREKRVDRSIRQVASPRIWWMLAAIVVTGILVFANGLSAPFILDDEDSIVRNPFITALWPLRRALQAPAQSSFSGRPLVSLSMAVSYAVDGLSPAVFRAANLAVLIASALVLFGVVRRTIRRADPQANPEWLAWSAAMLWLVHPLQTEVVDYITQRTESLMGLCYLLTMYAACRLIDDGRRRWAVLGAITCALGMACKESMVTAPLMVLVYDAVFGAGSFRDALARRRVFYAALASTWVVLAILNFGTPRSGSAGFATAISATDYLLNQAVMIVTYLKLSVWPHPLVIDYGRTTAIALSTAMPYVVTVTVLILLVALAWRQHRVLAFLGTWFFVTLAPSSSIVPIASEVGAERRMHLPLVAIVILLLLAVTTLVSRRRGSQQAHAKIVVSLGVVLSLAFGIVTFLRNREYYDHVAMWKGVVAHHPHGRAHYNLAIALTTAGERDEALAHYRDALPGEPAAHYALGFEASQAGRPDEAISDLKEFVRLRPADPTAPKAWLLIGEALVQLRRLDEAETAFQNALQQTPDYADALGELADVQLRRERFGDAITNYRAYLNVMPNAVNARHSLGLALALSGRESDAVVEFAAAVALRPADPQLRKSLGTALASIGRIEDAIAQYREAIRLAPDDEGIRREYAATLAMRK